MDDQNPYTQSYQHVQLVRKFVTDTIDEQIDYANSTRSSVSGTLATLANFTPTLNFTGTVPVTPIIDVSINADVTLPEINASDFGTISGVTAGAPSFIPVRDPGNIDITPFMPSVAGLNIPEAPDAAAPVSAPTRPGLSGVDIPGAPVLDKPLFPSLATIEIPEFAGVTLPLWNATAPEFEGTAVSTVLQWGDPQYDVEIIDEVVDKLRELWAGSNGIPPAIEQAMWERAANREDLDVSRQISAADIEYSSRGFTMPPGMHAARIDTIREEAQIKKQGLNREIAIKMAEIQVENVRFAVEQGIASENVLFNIWNNIAQRQFEAAKIQLDAQLALYNAQVALFNARQSAYATEAQVFKARLDAELATIEVFKAELEGELARGQLNEQRVRIYGEQIRALLADVEVYKAVMQGASIQSDVNRNIIEGFKADVQAYAEQIRADKVRFEAYESRIKGELGKAQILDAEARGYSAYVSGQATIADIGIKRMQGDISQNELKIREYAARLDADKAKIQADLAKVQAGASAYTADTQRYTAQAGVQEAGLRVQLAAKEAEIRASLGIFDVEVRKYMADMEQVIRKAQIQLEALKAAGQVGSTLAAGAMAGINVGANLSGSGGVSASGSQSYGRSISKSNSTGINISGETDNTSVPNASW